MNRNIAKFISLLSFIFLIVSFFVETSLILKFTMVLSIVFYSFNGFFKPLSEKHDKKEQKKLLNKTNFRIFILLLFTSILSYLLFYSEFERSNKIIVFLMLDALAIIGVYYEINIRKKRIKE